jgi:hypothetical protein
MPDLRRRQFITLLGGAAVAPQLAASAQQAAMPVICSVRSLSLQWLGFLAKGFLRSVSAGIGSQKGVLRSLVRSTH